MKHPRQTTKPGHIARGLSQFIPSSARWGRLVLFCVALCLFIGFTLIALPVMANQNEVVSTTTQGGTGPHEVDPMLNLIIMSVMILLSSGVLVGLYFLGWHKLGNWRDLPTRAGRFTLADPIFGVLALLLLGLAGFFVKYPDLLPFLKDNEARQQQLLGIYGAAQLTIFAIFFVMMVIAIFRSTMRPENPEEMPDFLDIIDRFGFGLGPDVSRTFNMILFGVPGMIILAFTFQMVYTNFLMLIGVDIQAEAHETLRKMRSGELSLETVLLQAVLIAPIMEEIVFRGFLHTSILNQRFKLHRLLVIAICSFLFMIVHTSNSDWYVLPILFVLGVMWGVAYERTRSLIPPILMHVAFNGFQVMMVYLNM